MGRTLLTSVSHDKKKLSQQITNLFQFKVQSVWDNVAACLQPASRCPLSPLWLNINYLSQESLHFLSIAANL